MSARGPPPPPNATRTPRSTLPAVSCGGGNFSVRATNQLARDTPRSLHASSCSVRASRGRATGTACDVRAVRVGAVSVAVVDPFAPADQAGLVHVHDAIAGITRDRTREGWVYRSPDGRVIDDDEERTRIRTLGIPPAWTHVWISPIPQGHIQATGRDARGRKQYRYHPLFRALRDGTKYHRMGPFGETLPDLRRRVDGDLSLEGLPRERVLAAAVRLMDETLIRVGNEEYAKQNHSYGITTMHHDHVKVEGETILFDFRAKSGKEQHVRLRDPL